MVEPGRPQLSLRDRLGQRPFLISDLRQKLSVAEHRTQDIWLYTWWMAWRAPAHYAHVRGPALRLDSAHCTLRFSSRTASFCAKSDLCESS